MPPKLRGVRPDEKAPAAPADPPKTVAQAAKSGDKRALLVSMRDRVAKAVTAEDCPARDLASLTKRLSDIAKEIEALDAREDSDLSGRVAELESALRSLEPGHPLLAGDGVVDDSFDASAI